MDISRQVRLCASSRASQLAVPFNALRIPRRLQGEERMKNASFPTLLSIAIGMAVLSATFSGAAQTPGSAPDPSAPTATTLTSEQIDAQWTAANSKYDGERK